MTGMGRLRYREFEGRLYIESDGEEIGESKGEALQNLLLETAAYRRFFDEAKAEKILNFTRTP